MNSPTENVDETECQEAQRRLSTDVQLDTCNGVTLIDPDTIDDDYINLWLSFTILDTDQKRLHDHLICSWNKRKIAMIDNGYYIDIDNIESLRQDPDLIIKYIMTTQCGIRTLTFNVKDEPTTIYYDRSLWKEAGRRTRWRRVKIVVTVKALKVMEMRMQMAVKTLLASQLQLPPLMPPRTDL